MKKSLLYLLSLVFAVTTSVSVNAQEFERIGTYTYCGMEKPVSLKQEKQLVIIEAHDTGPRQKITLSGKEELESFKNSLVDMRNDFITMKENEKEVCKIAMPTSFRAFNVYWNSSDKKTVLAGICNSFHPYFQITRNKKTKELDFFAVIDERVKDVLGGGNPVVLFLCFQNENEIQSLIDVLDRCLERISSPSSSQNSAKNDSQNPTEKNAQILTSKTFWPSKGSFFNYTRVRGVGMKGLISPIAIEDYKILFINIPHYSDDNYYIAIRDEITCDAWVSILSQMKELFLKNDKIAKDNDVKNDIQKDVSDKFSFPGYIVSLWNKSVTPIGKEEGDAKIGVEYQYVSGKSSMILSARPSRYDKSWYAIFSFRSVQDFDEIINAITWSNYMEAFNVQADEIRRQQDLEARKKSEEALFN